jgi:uncharacterized protein YcfJ
MRYGFTNPEEFDAMTTSLSRIHLTALALLAGGALTSGLAQAQPVAQQLPPQPQYQYQQPQYQQPQPPSTVVARVVSATPQWQQVPVQACDPAAAAPTGGGAAVGALAGGAIGSQMGSGNGHIAGAILGAIGGALAGNAIEAQNRAATGAGCGVQYQNQLTGYDVLYEWSGRQYRTQMAADPGQWVRVAEPVGDGSYAEPAYASAAPPQQPAYPYPAPGYPAPGYPGAVGAPPPQQPIAGNQVIAPPPQPAYNAYPAYPQPVYAAPYPAPAYPAPVYVAPPVGLSIGVGGGGRRGGWGVGVGF